MGYQVAVWKQKEEIDSWKSSIGRKIERDKFNCI